MCALHETDRGRGRQTSTFWLHLTVWGAFGRGLPSGPDERKELGRKRDEILDLVLGLMVLLALFGLLVLWGLGGIWRNHPTGSTMLQGSMGELQQGRENLGDQNLSQKVPQPPLHSS